LSPKDVEQTPISNIVYLSDGSQRVKRGGANRNGSPPVARKNEVIVPFDGQKNHDYRD